jgi:N-acetylglucosamine-1-phosphodiester alpha-N-acetylglucosaminidase
LSSTYDSAGCTELVQPSKSSKDRDCQYATNGGFFTWDMSDTGSLCIGNLISDAQVWQLPTDGSGTGRANFGITDKNEYVSGFINADVLSSRNFTQLITGWGWLVRNGTSYVSQSSDLSYSPGGFTMEKAPRTMVGYYTNGSMILVEIDGEEDINEGPDLFEAAELLVSLGVQAAINIDGGGSSVSVYDGMVINEPTCNDTPEICERADASFTCVKKKL